ncbi:ATP-binding protein [Periweissella cryptocerci]|uniref:ATP-binding protein n=1 Tax=Periweissella cryptocerci TaxID=2506420 RepID=A0A4P6YS11_9LACO|nr:ATP-binding protein [Periweissella cryptocerci]QBO35410.1 ATP-binding protein [Periweissella cryptocerci]
MNKFSNALVDTVKHIASTSNFSKPALPNMTPEELSVWRAERDSMATQLGEESLRAKKAKAYQRDSLYPANIPLTFKFADWKPSKQVNEDSAKALGNQAWTLAHELLGTNYNVVLMGTAGVGKTSLGLAMLDVIGKKKSTMFVNTADLKRLLQASWRDSSAAAKLDNVERSMQEVDVLLLDDLGTEVDMSESADLGDLKQGSQTWQELIYRIFTPRTIQPNQDEMQKTTIITTNNKYAELQKMYNDKLVSRLIPKRDSGHMLVFSEMEDLRKV